MAITFPINPIVGQVYTNPISGDSWKWNGYAWDSLGNVNPIGPAGQTGETGATGPTGPQGATGPGGGTNYFLQNTLPIDPSIGDRWYNTSTGLESVYIYDGASFQWITPAIAGPAGSTGTQGATGPTGPTGISGAREYWPDVASGFNHRVLWPNYNGPGNTTFHTPNNFCGGIFWNYDDLQITEARIRMGITGSGNGYVALYQYNLSNDDWLLVATTSEYTCSILTEQLVQFIGGTVSMVQDYYSIGAIQSTNGPRLTCNSVAALRTIFGYGGNYLSSHNSCLQFNWTYSVTLPANQTPSYGAGYGGFFPMIYVK